MKLTLILLTAAMLHVSAEGVSQSVSFSGRNIPLKRIFAAVESQTGYVVFGNLDVLEGTSPVSLNVRQMPLSDFLSMALKDQQLSFRIVDKTINLFRKPVTAAGSAKEGMEQLLAVFPEVSGVVSGTDGKPLAGVSVKLKGALKGTVTDDAGRFSLKNVADNAILIISSIGFRPVEIAVAAYRTGVPGNGMPAGSLGPGGSLSLTIVLVQMEAVLDTTTINYVNTGYQTLPKERVTGSFSTVSHQELSARLQTNLIDRLEGLATGLFIKNGDVTIRGISTLYGEQEPLYVVDGFPYEGSIGYLNPADITNITVMKDAAAASIYGTRAANGVISITTRLGSGGKLKVNYNSSLFISPIPDRSYLNLLSSREAVDLQEELFNLKHPDFSEYIQRAAQPKAIEALYQHANGELTQQELDAILDKLRGQDNTSQLKDLLLQNQLKHQHSFSVAGGNQANRYNISINYIGNRGYAIKGKSENVNIGFKDQLDVFKWLVADVGVASNFTKSETAPINALGYYRSIMPYEMLKDGNGENTAWNYRKSAYEINRLIGLGLYDETYNPLNELDKYDGDYRSNYIRWQGGFSIKFMQGVSLDLKYQMEKGNSYNKSYYTKNSYLVKNMVNDAAYIDSNGDIQKPVPDGGQIYETRGDSRSYTMRAQFNFDREIAPGHRTTAVLGTERRSVANSSTATHRMGYDDINLKFVTVNARDLADIKGAQSINGSYSYDESQYNYILASEDRYVSFYGNIGHTFREKYNISGSARIDESNLFGTDPKYRYLPLWSTGASWHIYKEPFMERVNWLNSLTLRVTYGLNGNVTKKVGPFLQAETKYNTDALAMATTITFPPNKLLRWEKTAVTNLGIDFAILNRRISGAIDLYSRKSTDLLGEREIDPTNAFMTALINYGSLVNRGVELALNTVNVRSGRFSWNTRLNFSYNKNKMTEISTRYPTVYGYTDGSGIEKVGYPMSSLFNFRWAGLDPENGTVMVYDEKGEVVKNHDGNGGYVANMTNIDGLVYSGTLRPTYTVGFNNSFSYGKLSLQVFIIANGGNVMRDAVPQVLTSNSFNQNIDRRAMNFWRKPGDEKIPGIMPAPDLKNNSDSYFASLWYAADINTLKADYIKVRDISLSYDFASRFFRPEDVSAARLTLQVQNPFKWFRNDRGLDPEAYAPSSIYSQRTLPVTPVYMIGVDFSF